MKRFFTKKRSVILAVILVAALITVDFSARSAVRNVMASAQQVPITCVESNKNEVALTYCITGKTDIKNILNELGSTKITFFISCSLLSENPGTVYEIIGKGHEIGLLFDDLKGKTKQEVYDELAAAVEETAFIAGRSCKLIRFAFNSYDGNAVRAVFSVDLYPVQWSADSTMRNFSSGDIILLTDDTNIRYFTEKISADGFRTVTVSEMLIKGEYKVDLSGEMSAD